MKRLIVFACLLMGLFASCTKDELLTEPIKKCSGCSPVKRDKVKEGITNK